MADLNEPNVIATSQTYDKSIHTVFPHPLLQLNKNWPNFNNSTESWKEIEKLTVKSPRTLLGNKGVCVCVCQGILNMLYSYIFFCL